MRKSELSTKHNHSGGSVLSSNGTKQQSFRSAKQCSDFEEKTSKSELFTGTTEKVVFSVFQK